MEDRVIPDIMNDVFLPQGRYPENFVLIYQLEVCQEGGVNVTYNIQHTYRQTLEKFI